MAAQIIQLNDFRSNHRTIYTGSQPVGDPTTVSDSEPPKEIDTAPAAEHADVSNTQFHFWTGASGRRYVHTTYSLMTCPELPDGNYILARVDAEGRRNALAVGRTTHRSQSLNLAEIRQHAAKLGANEVHVHLLASNAKHAKLIEYDIRASHFGAPAMSQAHH